MATELTQLARLKSQQTEQRPAIVLRIDGVETIFTASVLRKYIRIGDPGLLIGDDWVIGGLNAVENQRDIISLDGTTTTISQQLLQDKGGTSSVSAIDVSLLDLDEEITRLITPGEVVDEILGRKAEVFLGYQDTAFPQDFVRIFAGFISDVTSGAVVTFTIAHPEQKKRSEIFTTAQTKLTSAALFRAIENQGLRIMTRRSQVTTVSITYTPGATAGNEIVTVVGSAITVQIESGVSTAGQVKSAIEKSAPSAALVEVQAIDAAVLVTTLSTTNLTTPNVINVETTATFLTPAAPYLRTYLRINDEVMEYTGLTSTQFTGVTRAALETVDARARGDNHDEDDTVESFYRITGNAFDLALYIMMSNQGLAFAENLSVSSIVEVENVGSVPQAVYFEGRNIADDFGIVAGDTMSITGDAVPGNNVTDALISSVVNTQFGSYVTIDAAFPLVTSLTSLGLASFKSKYDVFPVGASLQMGGDQVDVPRFEEIRDLFSSSIFEYDMFVKETKSAKDFIDTELLFPTGAYTLPRRGKVSVGYTSPPLAIDNLVTLDESNVINPRQNKIKRSVSKYFYNNVLFKYDQLVTDDTFARGRIETDAESRNRIKLGNKTLAIPAPGVRDSSNNLAIMGIISKRLLERYRLAAESIRVQGFYGDIFSTDVGDVVLFGSEELNLSDTKNGSRSFEPRLWEVANKSMDIKSGVTTLDLVDTSYLVDGRYGIFSPSSQIASGSTTTLIRIENSYGWELPKLEREKWNGFIGEKIRIHDLDWTFDETVTLVGFSPTNDYQMIVSPALSVPPTAGMVVDIAEYQDAEASLGQIYKNIFCFFDPTVAVTTGTSSTVFEVGAGDIGKFLEGATIIVHNEDWTEVSPETTIASIAGNELTVDDDLGFTPDSSHIVDLIGFIDRGKAYRFL